MNSIQFGDELVKDYLLFRGFVLTVKTFDAEIKLDKDKGFRPEKIVDHLTSMINSMDLNGLLDAWSHLERRLFCRLEHTHSMAARKLETSLFRLYIVTCLNNGKPEKVSEFYEKMMGTLFDIEEWREWFVIPFIKSPEENQLFRVYFSRQWQETVLISLHNFLSIIFQNMPYPTLLRYENAVNTLNSLRKENECLKNKLQKYQNDSEEPEKKAHKSEFPEVPQVLMDDFAVIAQESPQSAEPQQSGKSLKSLIRNIGGGLPTSPLLGRNRGHNGKHDNEGGRKIKPRSPSVPPSVHMSKSPQEHYKKSQDAGTRSPAHVREHTHSVSEEPKWWGQRKEQTNVRETNEGSQSPAEDVKSSNQKGDFLILSQEEYIEHHATITHCRFNGSGDQVASCDMDGVIKVWKPNPTPQTLTTIMSKNSVLALDWASKREQLLLYGTKTGRVRVYDTKERRNLCDMEVCSLGMSIRCLVCNPVETHFVCATSQPHSQLLLYDIRTLQLEKNLNLRPASVGVTCCVFNHNSQLLMVGTTDGRIQIFDTRGSECIATWTSHPSSTVHCLQFSSDETSCFSMGSDGKFIQWNVNKTGQKMRELELHAGATGPFSYADTAYEPVGKLFDVNGSHLLTCGPSGGIIYKVSEESSLEELSLGGHRASPVCAVDWNLGLGCGTCVTAALDGHILVTTLLPQ